MARPAQAQKHYWLMKSEPDAFSIADLRRQTRASWDGVRNYQARNNMDAMAVGDEILFYHSNARPPGVVGVARVVRTAYPDHTAFDPKSPYYDPKSSPDAPRWRMVDVEFVAELAQMVSLADIQNDPALRDMVVAQRGRLSVQPVRPQEFAHVLRLGGLAASRRAK